MRGLVRPSWFAVSVVWALVALGQASCKHSSNVGFGIALTLRFDASVSDSALAQVHSLRFRASGDESGDNQLTPSRLLTREERVVYRPGANARSLAILVTAEDAAGALVAEGTTGALVLATGATTVTQVTLTATSPTDAGVPDLSGSDAATDLSLVDAAKGICSPSAAPCATGGNVLFCEGFETPSSNFGFTYTCTGASYNCNPTSSDSVLEYVSTPSCLGNQALHAAAGASADHVSYVGWRIPSGETELYARVFARKAAGSGDANIMAFFGSGSDGTDMAPSEFTPMLGWVGSNTFQLDGTNYIHASTNFDQWTCVEFYVNRTGARKVWVDVDLVADVPAPAGGLQYTFDFASLGRANLISGGASSFYFDEFVMSRSRIGCQ